MLTLFCPRYISNLKIHPIFRRRSSHTQFCKFSYSICRHTPHTRTSMDYAPHTAVYFLSDSISHDPQSFWLFIAGSASSSSILQPLKCLPTSWQVILSSSLPSSIILECYAYYFYHITSYCTFIFCHIMY